MGVLMGAVAATCWGLGDFLITLLTRRAGTARSLVLIQAASLLAWILLLSLQPTTPASRPFLGWILAATALCHVLGLVFVYRAFEVGTLSIVSPISAGFAVVTALLSLARGERPPALALGGAALLIGGAVLAVRSPSQGGSSRSAWIGVPEAVLSALAFGTMFWLFYFFVQPSMGFRWPLVVLKLAALTAAVLASLRKPESPPDRSTGRREVFLLAVGAALADTLAWLAYIHGASTSYATIVTALASLFSVVTVLLAWGFLRERLAVHQWSGVAAILLGILLVSV